MNINYLTKMYNIKLGEKPKAAKVEQAKLTGDAVTDIIAMSTIKPCSVTNLSLKLGLSRKTVRDHIDALVTNEKLFDVSVIGRVRLVSTSPAKEKKLKGASIPRDLDRNKYWANKFLVLDFSEDTGLSSYSNADKRNSLAIYMELNSYKEAENVCGIPRNTIRRWYLNYVEGKSVLNNVDDLYLAVKKVDE